MTAAHRSTSTNRAPAHRASTTPLFVVDSKGTAHRGFAVVARSVRRSARDVVATAAGTTSEVITASTPNNWFVQLFETEAQRNSRVTAELVAATLGLVARLARRSK